MNERVAELILVNICPLSIKKMKALFCLILALSNSCKPQSKQTRLTEGYSKLFALEFGNIDSNLGVEALGISKKTPQMWQDLR